MQRAIALNQRKEFAGLSRQLTAEEQHFLRGLGHRGATDAELRRVLLALLTTREENDQRLTPADLEVLRYYLKYPEERGRALKYVPPRSQADLVVAALFERYLLRNDGRMTSTTYSSGPRRALNAS